MILSYVKLLLVAALVEPYRLQHLGNSLFSTCIQSPRRIRRDQWLETYLKLITHTLLLNLISRYSDDELACLEDALQVGTPILFSTSSYYRFDDAAFHLHKWHTLGLIIIYYQFERVLTA